MSLQLLRYKKIIVEFKIVCLLSAEKQKKCWEKLLAVSLLFARSKTELSLTSKSRSPCLNILLRSPLAIAKVSFDRELLFACLTVLHRLRNVRLKNRLTRPVLAKFI